MRTKQRCCHGTRSAASVLVSVRAAAHESDERAPRLAPTLQEVAEHRRAVRELQGQGAALLEDMAAMQRRAEAAERALAKRWGQVAVEANPGCRPSRGVGHLDLTRTTKP